MRSREPLAAGVALFRFGFGGNRNSLQLNRSRRDRLIEQSVTPVRVEMRRGGTGIFTVGPGETIGNMALFERQPSVVTATAKEATRLLAIDREEFFDLLADHGEMSRELFQALFKRMRSLLSAGLGASNTGSGARSS